MQQGLTVFCGQALDDASLTPLDDLARGQSRIGHADFGPASLLRDLELRLGIASHDLSRSVRIARWSARLAQLSPKGRFYSRSYEVDAWGTAAEVLAWRDALVESGWSGTMISNGGERLEQLAEAEALKGTPLPPGRGDRLLAVAHAIRQRGNPGYARVDLAEPQTVWSFAWRQVFAALVSGGCAVDVSQPKHTLAAVDTDLGKLQRHLLEGGDFVQPNGDGSLVLLRGETVWESAHATTALLRQWAEEDQLVVIRSGDRIPLDTALGKRGLATMGLRSSSRFRAMLQVLPLALELAFDPKDPRRVLEFIALPRGPFASSSYHLAYAISRKPGIGSDLWSKAKDKIAESIRAKHGAEAEPRVEKVLTRIAEWIEAPGLPADGAPREALLAVIGRVSSWLQGKMLNAGDDQLSLLQIAYGQAAALRETMSVDPRAKLSLVQVRQLIETVAGYGGAIELHEEQAGRIDHVDSAAALHTTRGTVVWWGCTANTAESERELPFDRRERDALMNAGVELPDARAAMTEHARAWRRAILSATSRCVFVAPRFDKGEMVAVHPIWDEITARLGGDQTAIAAVSADARAFLEGRAKLKGVTMKTEEISSLPLPKGRHVWRLPAQSLGKKRDESATSLETLLGCPLRWVFENAAELSTGNMETIPADHQLYGTLGHRLVEVLHQGNVFSAEPAALRKAAGDALDALLPQEGATLLLAGQRDELTQIREQLTESMVRLGRLLASSKLRIVGVEQRESIEWRGRKLNGRLDVLLKDAKDREVVLDLKWGRSGYEKKLKEGSAVQLAVYAYLRRQATGGRSFPASGYFSLRSGTLLTVETDAFIDADPVRGADVEDTWRRAEAMLALIEKRFESGVVHVPGALDAPALAVACGAEANPEKLLVVPPDAACEYCEYDAICGRRWEGQR